jgi:hypothetical protein
MGPPEGECDLPRRHHRRDLLHHLLGHLAPTPTHHPANLTHHPANLTHHPANLTDHPADLTDDPANLTHDPANLTDDPANLTDHPLASSTDPLWPANSVRHPPAPAALDHSASRKRRLFRNCGIALA